MMFRKDYLFILNEKQAKILGLWSVMTNVKVKEMKEVIIEERLNWMIVLSMTLIDRLMYKIDFPKGIYERSLR